MAIHIDGVDIRSNNQNTLCVISTLSDQLKNIIRAQLANIYHGRVPVKEDSIYHSYHNSLKLFIESFKSKSVETKKGMIGELLAHILINSLLKNFDSLSILKNKEEHSIKKGFDIIYFDKSSYSIWYSEVKSGNRIKGKTSDYSNNKLLKRSKKGIVKMFKDKRSKLWDSALIDVRLTIADTRKRLNLNQLLMKDSPIFSNKKPNENNVVLISVLFHGRADKIDFESIMSFAKEMEAFFLNVIVFSIQKNTYTKIYKFLHNESRITP